MNPFEAASQSLKTRRPHQPQGIAMAPAQWGRNAKWLVLVSGCVLFATLSQMTGSGSTEAAGGPGGAVVTVRASAQTTDSGADPSESASSSDEDGSDTTPSTDAPPRPQPVLTTTDSRPDVRRKLPYPDEANVPPPPCATNEISTGELTSFPFWGTTYNTSSPCPTSGMNNQMQMLMFYHNCKEAHAKPVLQWKDITCSPTGGVHKNGGRYEVGSKSYVYTWYRWSSLFNVTRGGICYSDNYTWSMHGWLKGCGFTDSANKKFYGTESYWKQRPLFDYRESFYTEVEHFLQDEGLAGEKFLAVHLRRGDYSKFCKEIKKSYKKLRLAHWKWAKARGARDLYDRHSDTCAPKRDKVVAGINRLLELHGVSHVLMATTDPDFLPGSADFERDIKGKVHAFNASNYAMSAAAYTAVDSILLAKATHRILNRYSTLSLTAVDLSVIRGWFNNETTWFW